MTQITPDAAPMHASPLLTPRQVAAYLQIPVGTLYDWRYRGVALGTKVIKVGNHLRWRAEDIEEYLESRRVA